VNYTVSYSDNCSGATLQQTAGLPSGSIFPAGVTTNTFVVTDASGNTNTCSFTVAVTDNQPPTFTLPADKTILFTGTCSYDASPAVTGDVINEYDNCSTDIQATYQDAVAQCGNNVVIERTWSLADNNGNHAASQVQTITVTDNNTSYIVYARKEARFGEFNLINGSVGVTGATGKAEFKAGTVLPDPYFARAKNIIVNILSIVPNRITSPADDGPNPPFFNFAGTTSGLPNRTISSSTTVPVSANYKELTIKKNVTVTITGTLYGKIKIEEGAQVTFTPAGGIINIENMDVTGKLGSPAKIKFGSCTAVRIKDKIKVGEYTQWNVDGPKVIFYLGDTNPDDEQFIVDGTGNIISINIYIRKGQLNVNGDFAVMKGWFIAEKVTNTGRFIVWSSNECNSPGSSRELMVSNLKTQERVTKIPETTGFTVRVSPNPSSNYFTLRIESNKPEPVTLRITDMSGKLITSRSGIASNSVIQTGADLNGGMYFAEVIQNKERKVVKLIKL
ncbi:MAG TPA: T9SS type A sorting domain-containing protein, partial [Chitinophagaceae bacterium]|nr:T9SS type A sorting domain-containing protein [Chitinophagaceae bacterium]